MAPQKIREFDGNDEIIYSKNFVVYEDKLTIHFLNSEFIFVFEKEDSDKKKSDIQVKWSDDESSRAIITISNSFRKNIHSAATSKLSLFKNEQESILFSVAGNQVGDSILNININFYKRND